MVVYLNLLLIGKLSIELKTTFTSKPIWRNWTCNNERIIDIPFARLIYTPPSWPLSKELPRDQAQHQTNTGSSKRT